MAGLGGHGVTLWNAIRACENLHLVSCFDPDEQLTAEVASDFGARVAANFEELVADSEAEAVVLASPNHLHSRQVAAALAEGKHVFVEKPITVRVAEAIPLIEQAEAARLVLMVGHNTRRRPVFRKAKELLNQGVAGSVISFEAHFSRQEGVLSSDLGWRAESDKCPALPIMQLGIHFIDTIATLLSDVKEVASWHRNAYISGGVIDSTVSLLRLENGCTGTLVDHYVTPTIYELRIVGTEGIIHCFDDFLRFKWERGEEVRRQGFEFDTDDSYVEQMREFGHCVRTGDKPETDGRVGLRALAVVEALTLAHEEQRVVSVQEILARAEG
jgi:predicted dehydrogenase